MAAARRTQGSAEVHIAITGEPNLETDRIQWRELIGIRE
jgi:hypothetical protein